MFLIYRNKSNECLNIISCNCVLIKYNGMELIIICLVAFITAILTFFSGFGLGTILMPVFAIFFPVEIAIALGAGLI